MNKLYTFTIDKTVKVEKREPNEDGSFKLTYEDKVEPVKVFLKKPTIRERDEFSYVYDVAFSKAVAGGIQTWDMLRKYLLDNGGLDSKTDIENLDQTLKDIQVLQGEYEDLSKSESESESLKDLQKQISDLYKEYSSYEERQMIYFNKSAESRARQKTIKWCVLNLLFYDTNPPTYVFKGLNDESRENDYYELAEKYSDGNECIELKAFDRAFILMDAWIKGNIKTENDFKELDTLINTITSKTDNV